MLPSSFSSFGIASENSISTRSVGGWQTVGLGRQWRRRRRRHMQFSRIDKWTTVSPLANTLNKEMNTQKKNRNRNMCKATFCVPESERNAFGSTNNARCSCAYLLCYYLASFVVCLFLLLLSFCISRRLAAVTVLGVRITTTATTTKTVSHLYSFFCQRTAATTMTTTAAEVATSADRAPAAENRKRRQQRD